MSSKFIALPVGRGDSFFLKRKDRAILFDGGMASTLPSLITKYTNCNKIDVVVCSHNDADHAKGLISLLEDSSISVSEVWLPGRWLEVVCHISSNTDKFLWDLLNDTNHLKPEALEDLSTSFPDSENQEYEEQEIPISEEFITDTLDRIEENLLCRIIPYFHRNLWLYRNQIRFDAIDAAERILKIAKRSQERGCKIRWFDFKKFKNGNSPCGGEDWLRPLNSVEIKKFNKSKQSALALLVLSVANKESLTFVSTVKDEPSVVFTADSDLKKVKLPTLHNPLVTAPHHGSTSNSSVYTIPDLIDSIWVRSDMASNRNPCREFISQNFKFCTRCRSPKTSEQCVTLTSCEGKWIPLQETTKCHCK